MFVPIVADGAATAPAGRAFEAAPPPGLPEHCIEIRLGDAVIRVARGTDFAWLTKVLRAVRTSAA